MNPQLNITRKLALVFVLFAAIVVVSVGILAYSSGRAALEEAVSAELLSTVTEKEAALNNWAEEQQSNLIVLANSPDLLHAVARLTSASNSNEAQTVHEQLILTLQPWVEAGEFLELLVLEAETGRVIAATNPDEEGKFRENQPYFIEGKTGPYLSRPYYSVALQGTAMTVSAPLNEIDGETEGRLLAVLAGRLNLEELNSIIQRRAGRHQSDDAYLVNTSNLFVTQPRFISDPAVLRRGIHTEMVNDCLRQESGLSSSTDYRDVPVLAAYRWLPEHQLCLVVQLDEQEALGPIRTLGNRIALLSGLALIAASVLAIGLARTITRPVLRLQQGAARLGRGELHLRLPEDSHDELGLLAQEFNRMAAALAEKEAQLRTYATSLEWQVEQQTADLRESESQYRQLAETAKDIILTHDLEGRILYLNQAGQKITGYDAEEIRQMRIPDFIPANQKSELEQRRIKRSAGDSNVYRYEITIAGKAGQLIPLDIVSSLLTRHDGSPSGVLIIGRDLTDQKRAEERFRLVVESTPTAIIVVNEQSQMVLVNSQAELLFGYDRQELIGQPVEMLLPERFREQHPAYRAGFLANPIARPIGVGRDLYGLHKEGREVPIEISLSPIESEGELLILSAIVDITGRKQAAEALAQHAEELRRSNAELEQFAYVASHDLQEPLRMVASYLQLIQRRYQGQLDADADEFITFAVDGANRMKTLINDLLAYSRIGMQGKALEPTSCEEILKQVLNSLQLAIAESGATVSAGPLPTVLADPVQLHQLFQNLISNALKFRSQAPPQIQIGAEQRNGEWLFSVQDNGIGLDLQYAERIFTVFQRLHQSADYPGTGIGLAICKKIVERHGGRIWVESEVGKGAIFYFTLRTPSHSPASLQAKANRTSIGISLITDKAKEER